MKFYSWLHKRGQDKNVDEVVHSANRYCLKTFGRVNIMLKPYTGYHGSSLAKCQDILSCNYFTESHKEDGWLGNGIYFFEGNHWYATWWASVYKRFNPYGVLQASINAEETRILDLTIPEKLDELDEIAEVLSERRRRSPSHADKTITDAMVVNYLFNNIRKFDLVIGIFDDTHYRRRYVEYYQSRIRAHQIQLCVRDNKCISNIQQVS
jgi:hypothetical protein